MKKDDFRVFELGASKLLARPILKSELEKFLNFFYLLKKWNSVFNLTAIKENHLIVSQHFLDCLSVIVFLDSIYSDCIFDIGAGAGFPGLVIAIVRPDWKINLVESSCKKYTFLQQVITKLNLNNVTVFYSRVENLKKQSEFLDVSNRFNHPIMICRGFSSLKNFFNLTKNLIYSDCVWIAMKGKKPSQEIMELINMGLSVKVMEVEVPYLQAKRNIVIFKQGNEKIRAV